MWGSSFGLRASGFEVRVWGLGFGVWGLGFGGLSFGFWASSSRVLGFRVSAFEFRVPSFGFRVSNLRLESMSNWKSAASPMVVIKAALEQGQDEGEFFIDDLLVRIHFFIVMIRWSGLAP